MGMISARRMLSSGNNRFLILIILSCYLAKSQGASRKACKLGEFRCETGECLERERVCDSIRDCTSGIDEYVCTPKFRRGLCGYHRVTKNRSQNGLGDLGQTVISYLLGNVQKKVGMGLFQCQFGGCIPLKRLCDGNINCIGGTDESEICENNSCLPGQFRCKYGACIPDWQMCNGRANCPDGSDETPEACRHITCKNTEFRCRYGGCIPKERICDIKRHCADGSDEYDFLCLITRAKMVDQWGQEGKQINQEQESRITYDKVTSTNENAVEVGNGGYGEKRQESNYPKEVPPIIDEGHNPQNDQLSVSVEKSKLATTTSNPESNFGTNPGSGSYLASSTTTTTTTTTTLAIRPTTLVEVSNPSGSPTFSKESSDRTVKKCMLPDIPENSQSEIVTCVNFPTAEFCKDSVNTVPPGVVIQYDCAVGYVIYGPQSITCQENGEWSARPPDCELAFDVRWGFGSTLPNNFDTRCPALIPPRGTQVECIDPKDLEIHSCSEKQNPGIEAKFSCGPYYRSSGDLSAHYEKCGENGKWTPGVYDNFSCLPDCGISEAPKTPYILNGQSTKRGQWPWHVAIYLKHKGKLDYICGGVLITESAVITSAHCVTVRGNARNASEFLLFFGKYNRKIPDPDPFVQKRLLSKIIVEDSFNHIALDSDIAILSLKNPIVLSFYVRPACFPQTSNSFLEEYQLAPNSLGTVVGFGFTENGTLSDELRMTELPVVSTIQCTESHDDFFATMTRSTNYCAGYTNGTQVCNGDSGGGQYFKAVRRGNTRYYVQGLVSYGVPDLRSKTCQSKRYAIFTRVGRYGDWIVRTLSREKLI